MKRNGIATLAVASWNQILGWLQELNLLREAAPRIAAVPITKAAQPADFPASWHPSCLRIRRLQVQVLPDTPIKPRVSSSLPVLPSRRIGPFACPPRLKTAPGFRPAAGMAARKFTPAGGV
jgi:hypothetical protein